jgi:hypothetical protein
LRVSVHRGLMNKNSNKMQQIEFIFLRFFVFFFSGATFTHHQVPQLYKRVWCNCINRLCGWAKCVPDSDQLYGRCLKYNFNHNIKYTVIYFVKYNVKCNIKFIVKYTVRYTTNSIVKYNVKIVFIFVT